MNLADKLIAINLSLDRGGIEHAFGGAIALAYWTEDPRGTSDIDVNLFVAQENCELGLTALPGEVATDEETIPQIKRDGQIRLWWDTTPIDLFFDNLPIHEKAALNRREVPFEGVLIPILGPVELAIFKAMFDRTQDWADIEAMLRSMTLDFDELQAAIESLVGAKDPRLERLDEALRRADRDRPT
jgi:hypothetical protein